MNQYNSTNTWEDRDPSFMESRHSRHNGHHSTQDFENENARYYNRGREGDQDGRSREYNPRIYRDDYGRDINYGERYGFSGYGRSQYDPSINRSWQEEPSVQSWREGQPFTNREQDYRGGRWSRASHGYEHREPSEYREQDFSPREKGNGLYSGSSAYEDGMRFGGGPMGRESYQGRNSLEFDNRSITPNYGRGRYSGVGPQNYRRTDSRIEEDVCERLTEHPEVDASNIEVKVHNGEVTLSGSVQDRMMKRMAEDILDSISGVRDVNNQIHVSKSSGSSSSHESLNTSQRANGHSQEKRVKV